MKRTPFTFFVLLFAALLLPAPGAPLAAIGQVPPEAKPVDAADEKKVQTPAPAHASSPETFARISATLPKFSPPKEAQPAAEPPDLRDLDKPRNGIIRLPQHIVRESRMPDMKERDLLTPAGKLDLAYKRHPGFHFGSLVLTNDGPARSMLWEEERLERIAEANDFAGLMESRTKAGALMKDAIPLFLRSNEWIEGGGSWAMSKLQ